MSLEEGAARAWVLAFILMAGVGIGTLIGVGCLVGANTCPGKSRPTVTATEGREIYVRANCAGCHGADGSGGRGSSLVSGSLASLSVEELSSKIANGKRLAGMPKFEDQLTSAQIRAVAQYVVTLRGGS
jgi:mono/diheme cytochrome c family protein